MDIILQDFIPRLKDHLLVRLRGMDYSGDEHSFSDEDRSQVIIANNQLHEHSILQINYTTYDLRREQDSVNSRTHADIMLLSHEDDDDRHPYWYARVIKIFHVDVCYFGGSTGAVIPTRMDVLFVRWFGRDIDFKAGWSAKRLHRIGFFQRNDPDSFGFIDPDRAVRGVHLIPGYAHGCTNTRLDRSFVRPPEDDDKDFLYFYVNQYVPTILISMLLVL